MKPSLQRLLPVWACLILAAAAMATWLAVPHRSSAATIGGPFELVAGDGRSVTDADFRGEPLLVFFGYTHCPDVCPTTLFSLSETFAKLGADKKIGALFITVDPERDTPAILKDYLASFDGRIVGLTGTRPQVEAAMRNYRVYAKKVPAEGTDYSMDHSSVVYLMDKRGDFVSAFDLERKPEEAARDLSAYL